MKGLVSRLSRRTRSIACLTATIWAIASPEAVAAPLDLEQRIWLHGGPSWGVGSLEMEAIFVQVWQIDVGYDRFLGKFFPVVGITLQGAWTPRSPALPQLGAFSVIPYLAIQPNLTERVELRVAFGVGACFAFLEGPEGEGRADWLGYQYHFEAGFEIDVTDTVRIAILGTMRPMLFAEQRLGGSADFDWDGLVSIGGTVGVSWTFWKEDRK
jgi:hypothetical protein